MNDFLAPPVVEQPPASLGKHGDHWDPSVYITDDGGWTWKRRSAVNFPTEESAWDFLVEQAVRA